MFEKIIAPENIFAAWREFQKGKMKKADVLAFAERAEENLFDLILHLESGSYVHGKYTRFLVHDPKRRRIAKAPVRDRVLHHAVSRVLVPIFEPGFIFDSYSSRKEKGIHEAGKRLRRFALKLSRNHTRTVWVLQIDMRKFFDSVDHEILFGLLRKKIRNEKTMDLLKIIIESFETSHDKGIPLGNLTSQLFSNIYLDPLDQFMKRNLQVRFYLRYADDIAILSRDRIFLENCLAEIKKVISEKFKLDIHPQKIVFKKWHEGIDFLGYVHFPFHSVLRVKTKKRMFKKLRKKSKDLKNRLISEESFNQCLRAYFGVLKHCQSYGIMRKIKQEIK